MDRLRYASRLASIPDLETLPLGQVILIAPNYITERVISHYHEFRIPCGRHKPILTINIKDVNPIQNSEVNFKQILQETSILKYFCTSIVNSLNRKTNGYSKILFPD